MTDNTKMRDDAIREGARNHAMDEYFKARPQLIRTRHEERLFEAGFDRAWQAAQSEQAAELERLRKDAERLEWLHSHVRLLTKNWDWVGPVGFRQAIDVQMRLTEKEADKVAAMQERQS